MLLTSKYPIMPFRLNQTSTLLLDVDISYIEVDLDLQYKRQTNNKSDR